VPIPRRFDRRPPERDETRINERIRVPQVRLIGADGNQIGVVETQQALRYAQERDLDLVEVAADARPPVCRVLDYSKYKYEQEQKAKAARRHQKQVNVREIKLRPKIANNDYETKKNHVVRFLKGDDRVKVTIMFRGREQTHPERGERLLMRLAEDVAELGSIEQMPQQDGRNMTMLLAPVKRKPDAEADDAPAVDGSTADAPAADAAPANGPAPDAPAPDAPGADAAPADEPAPDAPAADAAPVDEPPSEEPAASAAEAPTADAPVDAS
jgi:translation initiation factor IF-3